MYSSINAQSTRYRCTHREVYFRKAYPQLSSIRQWMHDLWEGKHRRQKGDDEDPETGHGGERFSPLPSGLLLGKV